MSVVERNNYRLGKFLTFTAAFKSHGINFAVNIALNNLDLDTLSSKSQVSILVSQYITN